MIVYSYNIRGLGGDVKRRRIKQLILSENVDFMAIQETKLEAISDSLCYSLWEVQIVIGLFFRRKGVAGGYFRFGGR
jgi:exonuclease III